MPAFLLFGTLFRTRRNCDFTFIDIDLALNCSCSKSTTRTRPPLGEVSACVRVQTGLLMRFYMLLLLLLGFSGWAQADIWECMDGNGNKRFTNVKAEAAGCKPMNLPPVPSVPSPKTTPKGGDAKPQAAAGNFPKVDAPTQQQRDGDRRKILEQELANEQKLLDQAKKDLAEQESMRLGSERNYQRVLDRLEPYKKKVTLHENNVTNLRKELSALR